MADLATLAVTFGQLSRTVERVPKIAGHALGRLGKDVTNEQAVRVFGPDRKFSGARRSRKAKRAATVRYSIMGDVIEIQPSGDPWYIFVFGRGRSRIRPHRRRALRTPYGPRARVRGGRLRPRPGIIDPIVSDMEERGPAVVEQAIIDALAALR